MEILPEEMREHLLSFVNVMEILPLRISDKFFRDMIDRRLKEIKVMDIPQVRRRGIPETGSGRRRLVINSSPKREYYIISIDCLIRMMAKMENVRKITFVGEPAMDIAIQIHRSIDIGKSYKWYLPENRDVVMRSLRNLDRCFLFFSTDRIYQVDLLNILSLIEDRHDLSKKEGRSSQDKDKETNVLIRCEGYRGTISCKNNLFTLENLDVPVYDILQRKSKRSITTTTHPTSYSAAHVINNWISSR